MLDAYTILQEFGEKPGRENWGHDTDKPCCLCGKYNKNQSEPRFYYTVCIEHQHIPPMTLSQAGLT
jgi:hypothetical protein